METSSYLDSDMPDNFYKKSSSLVEFASILKIKLLTSKVAASRIPPPPPDIDRVKTRMGGYVYVTSDVFFLSFFFNLFALLGSVKFTWRPTSPLKLFFDIFPLKSYTRMKM